LKIAG